MGRLSINLKPGVLDRTSSQMIRTASLSLPHKEKLGHRHTHWITSPIPTTAPLSRIAPRPIEIRQCRNSFSKGKQIADKSKRPVKMLRVVAELGQRATRKVRFPWSIPVTKATLSYSAVLLICSDSKQLTNLDEAPLFCWEKTNPAQLSGAWKAHPLKNFNQRSAFYFCWLGKYVLVCPLFAKHWTWRG